jgi:hypothetical protein
MKDKDFGGMHWGLPWSKAKLVSLTLMDLWTHIGLLAPLKILILASHDLPVYAKNDHN